MDRDEALRRAEKLMRQGRLDAAIEEYAALVEANPRDWTTANLLGDLYIRAGRTDRAIAQYARIADVLAADGFLSRAAALYKKIVKIAPQDEHALMRAAELSAQQGLLADARGMLQTLFQRRIGAGDRAGAMAVARRHGTLEPSDVVGRVEAARMLAEVGDAAGASENLRLAGDTLLAQGREQDALRAWREALRLNPADRQSQERLTTTLLRQGDLDAAMASAQSPAERRAIAHALLAACRTEAACSLFEQVLAEEPADLDSRLHLARLAVARGEYAAATTWLMPALATGDPRVELALADADLRAGKIAAGGARLAALVARDVHAIDDVAALGVAIADVSREAGYGALTCALDALGRSREFERALGVLDRFFAAAPGYVPAVERQAELCREGRYDDLLYEAETRLVDLYLLERRYGEALDIAQRLAGLRPDVDRHRAQVSEAETGLGRTRTAPGPADARPVEPAHAFDLAEFAASLGLPSHVDEEPHDSRSPWHVTSAPAVDAAVDAAVESPRDPGPEPAPPAPAPLLDEDDDGVFGGEIIEIELGDELAALAGPEAADLPSVGRPEGSSAEPDLDAVFQQMRAESGRGAAEDDAMRAYDAAAAHYNEGRVALARECLRRAGRDSSLRFRACVMLGRIALDEEAMDEAVGWFERASEAPAPSVEASRSLLYALGDTLERTGERERAQAVFLELQSVEPGYRDVIARLARLQGDTGTGQTGGQAAKGPA